MMAGMITRILDRPPPRAQDPPRPGARKSGVTEPAGASTPAALRPAVVGPAVATVARLGGCRLRRPARHRYPVAAEWLQALLDLEEPPELARPPECLPGGPSAHPTHVGRQPTLGSAPDSREDPEAGHRDFPVADLAHVPRQPHPEPGLRGLLHRPTVTFKVLFVFVDLAHHRRRVVHCKVTDAPTAAWTAQQIVEAFPWETAQRYLLRDRDAVYGVVATLVLGARLARLRALPGGQAFGAFGDYTVERMAALTGSRRELVTGVLTEECERLYEKARITVNG